LYIDLFPPSVSSSHHITDFSAADLLSKWQNEEQEQLRISQIDNDIIGNCSPQDLVLLLRVYSLLFQ
jgi:hypothetical protein